MDEMNGADEPATKGFVREELGMLRGEFRAGMGLLPSELREEMSLFRGEIKDMLRPIVSTLANHSAELNDIRSYMKTQLVTREEFHTRMDGFTGRVEDQDYSAAKNRARLDDHERRLSALEKKPS